MLKALKSFLSELTGETGESRHFGADDTRLASAALLYHVIAIDGTVSPSERERLHDLLMSRYGLGAEETETLIEEAQAADQESVDLFRFTQVLKDRLSEDDRAAIIAMMWDLVFQDGTLHEFEDNTIWRVAELLAVPSNVRLQLKRAARDGGLASA